MQIDAGPGFCGDGLPPGPPRLPEDEQCDDGNDVSGDGCEPGTCARTITRLSAGAAHTCALLVDGRVKCWGAAASGQLGHGDREIYGDNEPASASPFTDVGDSVVRIESGGAQTCVIDASGLLRCWGLGPMHGHPGRIAVGADETPASVGSVQAAGPVRIATGGDRTCILNDSNQTICWGTGVLGNGNTEPLGDDEPISMIPEVDTGSPQLAISCGREHSCAIVVTPMSTGAVRCWGNGASGRLGYGTTDTIGDNETPRSAGAVGLGGARAIEVAAGGSHTCALLEGGAVICWGSGALGQLGTGSPESIGDNELVGGVGMPGHVMLDRPALQIAVGENHSCALLDTGAVRCWGDGSLGQIGSGDTEPIGDNELPTDDVVLGGPAVGITAGGQHTCALMATGGVRCWGFEVDGRLGYGDGERIGDHEDPADAGDVPVLP